MVTTRPSTPATRTPRHSDKDAPPAVTKPPPEIGSRSVQYLQRTLGNGTVAALLGRTRPVVRAAPLEAGANPGVPLAGVTIQRHSSFEHKLLGDMKPSALQIITDVREFHGPPPKPYDERKLNVLPGDKLQAVKALNEQLTYLAEWQAAPPGPGSGAFHGVRVVTVKCEDEREAVTCTIGEMNTLADYFSNPEQIKHAKKQTLTGILQQVRQDTWGQLHKVLQVLDPNVAAGTKPPTFAGSITSAEGKAKEGMIEAFTADGRNKATQTYLSNAARNACHFAPQSWYRWKDYHEQARAKARQAYEAKHQAKGKDNDSLLNVSQDLANEAMVTNGFGDHYLQDSFAGGHLINKTLIMQWFVEWLGTQRDTTLDKIKGKLPRQAGALIPEQSVGERWIRDWDKVKRMNASLQPKLAGLDLYDRPVGGVATDPQTVEEQKSRAERIKRAGISGNSEADKEQNYEAYLAMLNNPLIQLATKVLHDKFCAEGLVVGANGTPVGRVFGDDNMLTGGAGVGFSGETAQMSQTAITQIISDGKSDKTVQAIMNRLPNEVMPPGGKTMIPLKEWHTGGHLRVLCESEIFPQVLVDFPAQLGLAPGGSLGKVSQDVPGGTEPSADVQSKMKWIEDEIEGFKKNLVDFAQIQGDVEQGIDDLKNAAVGAAETVQDQATAVKDEAVRRYEQVRDELPEIRAEVEATIEDVKQTLSGLPIPAGVGAAGQEMVRLLQGGAEEGDASGGEF